MAATTYYASVVDADTVAKDVAHSGTSSTAGDMIELRMGDGTNEPTVRQVINALIIFERWLIERGTNGAGANMPVNSG
jgi:hypothetical protein